MAFGLDSYDQIGSARNNGGLNLESEINLLKSCMCWNSLLKWLTRKLRHGHGLYELLEIKINYAEK